MGERLELKELTIEDVRPKIQLKTVLEKDGDGYRVHHIKSDSISPFARDTFVPLRHVSKQKRRIFELEEENAELRKAVRALSSSLNAEQGWCSGDCASILDCDGRESCVVDRIIDEL